MAYHGTAGSPDSALVVAKWLRMAASPVFTIMALLTSLDASPMDSMCSHGHASLSGMVPMYLLMSAFHSAPWLNLLFGRRQRTSAA
jgi:hypothetical protein